MADGELQEMATVMHSSPTPDQRFDLVTVSYTGELPLLRLQARSIGLFGSDTVILRIFVIINDKATKRFERLFDQQIRPEYGRFASRVTLVSYKNMWDASATPKKLGWKSQQALKLMSARLAGAKNLLILDTKNHFIRPMSADAFIAEDGRLRTVQYKVLDQFWNHFARACIYFGAEIPDRDTRALPSSTPYLARRDIVLAMLSDIEQKEGMSFEAFFCQRRDYTEFYLYYAYLLSKGALLTGCYERRTRLSVNLLAWASKDPDKAAEALEELGNPNVLGMAVHRSVLGARHAPLMDKIFYAWNRFGLVRDRTEFSKIVRSMQKKSLLGKLWEKLPFSGAI